jgi:hypothetical protein
MVATIGRSVEVGRGVGCGVEVGRGKNIGLIVATADLGILTAVFLAPLEQPINRRKHSIQQIVVFEQVLRNVGFE